MIPSNPLPASVLEETPSSDDVRSLEPSSKDSRNLPFLCRRPIRITLYSFLSLFAAFMLAWGFLPSLLDPTFEQHIKDKQVVAGMTRDQAIAAWGSPYQMNVTYTDRGVRREEWVYEDWITSGTVRHRYLYFEEEELVGGWYYD